MNQTSSRILRIGLINSGMFNQLDLNLDVQSAHFIGANNVGKTSLIQLIQFLYFHQLPEMNFSKTVTESLAFYFRPEGSYLLFQVRTIQGAIRTVGIYGEGSADSRVNFVFDGAFELSDFMDAQQRPIKLSLAQGNLFSRRYSRYRRFEEYELALIGQNNNAEFNVPLFDLSLPNFRLLRQLLQGLLKLDRINSADVRSFIIQMIGGNVKTKLNIARDFDHKNRQIQQILRQLEHLREIKPLIEAWKQHHAEIDRLKERITEHTVAVYYLWQRSNEHLQANLADYEETYQANSRQQAEMAQQRDQLVQRREERNALLRELKGIILQGQQLEKRCIGLSRLQIEEEKKLLWAQRVGLEENLRSMEQYNLGQIERRLHDAQREAQQLEQRLARQTLEAVWHSADLREDQIALISFLASKRLASLPMSRATDRNQLLQFCHEAWKHVDQQGTLRIAGLAIPREEWYQPVSEQVPLEEQLAQKREEIGRIQAQRDVAANRAQAEQRLQAIKNGLARSDSQLGELNRWEDWLERYGSIAQKQREEPPLLDAVAMIAVDISNQERELRGLTSQREQLFVQINEVKRELQRLQAQTPPKIPSNTSCPEEISNLPSAELADAYRRRQERLRVYQERLRVEEATLQELQQQLEARYERESADIPFKQWIDRQLDIAHEIERVEQLLQENYTALFTQVRRELSNFIEAYEQVQERVIALNQLTRSVSISNISKVEIVVEPKTVLDALKQMIQPQKAMFDDSARLLSDGEQFITTYLNQLRQYGQELQLTDLFDLAFDITFQHSTKAVRQREINQFESNGTRIGVKIVLYLGLIKLLQGSKEELSARIPFFLDEVGSIDSHNLQQLLAYCSEHNFLPIFASPEIRADIPTNYIFQRDGKRSFLANVVTILPNQA